MMGLTKGVNVEEPIKSQLTDQLERKAWEPMRLVYVGDVRDLVRGGGKSGQNADSDPQNSTKSGVG